MAILDLEIIRVRRNRKFTKICVQREGRNFPFAFEFDEPLLRKLAVEFSGKQLSLKSMTRERITKETLEGTVTIPGHS